MSFRSALIQRKGGTRLAMIITKAIPRKSNNISPRDPSREGMKDWRYSSTAATAMAIKATKKYRDGRLVSVLEAKARRRRIVRIP